MKANICVLFFLSLSPLTFQVTACKWVSNDSAEVSTVDDTQLQVVEVLTAIQNTTLKSSLMQSSGSDTGKACPIPQGTILTAGSIKPEGIDHWRVFRITQVRLPNGEVGSLSAGSAQSGESSVPSTQSVASAKTPAELLSCTLINNESFLVFSPHFSRQKEQSQQSLDPDQVRETSAGSDGTWAWPTRGRKIRSDVGGSGHFNAPRASGKGHQGIDIVAAVGEPIFAASSGSIVDPSFESSYGKVVDVRHGGGYLSRYAHLTSFSYSHGTFVEKGDKIATSGRTGNASGPSITPHLHFEIRRNGKLLNPISLLP